MPLKVHAIIYDVFLWIQTLCLTTSLEGIEDVKHHYRKQPAKSCRNHKGKDTVPLTNKQQRKKEEGGNLQRNAMGGS